MLLHAFALIRRDAVAAWGPDKEALALALGRAAQRDTATGIRGAAARRLTQSAALHKLLVLLAV